MNCIKCGYGGTGANHLHDECPAPWEPSNEALQELADRDDLEMRNGIMQTITYKRSR
jgi:hypothetical protein